MKGKLVDLSSKLKSDTARAFANASKIPITVVLKCSMTFLARFWSFNRRVAFIDTCQNMADIH